VSGGTDHRVPGVGPGYPGDPSVELSGHDRAVRAAVQPDGPVITGGTDVLAWDPGRANRERL
jgi:hypothetical protein